MCVCPCVYPKQKYTAASLCSITTEVLKVLNATEELINEAGGDSCTPTESMSPSPISGSSDTRRLDQKLTKMEENVRFHRPCCFSHPNLFTFNVSKIRVTNSTPCEGLPDCWGRVRAGRHPGRPGAVRSQYQQRHH